MWMQKRAIHQSSSTRMEGVGNSNTKQWSNEAMKQRANKIGDRQNKKREIEVGKGKGKGKGKREKGKKIGGGRKSENSGHWIGNMGGNMGREKEEQQE